MPKLIRGIHRFQEHVFRARQGLFEPPAKAQQPDPLFIIRVDSRVDPYRLTPSDLPLPTGL